MGAGGGSGDAAATFAALNGRARYNIVVVSLSFAILFASYNSLQSYATSLFPPGLGDQSLGTLYGSVGPAVFFGPMACDVLGTKWTMIVGAVGYVLYMASLTIAVVPAVVLPMSVVIGAGAAVLWIAEGEFVKENSTPATRGVANGIFWSVFQLNLVVGNLLTWQVYSRLHSTYTLYLGFTVVGAVGTAALFALRSPAFPRVAGGAGARTWADRWRELGTSMRAVVALLVTPDSLLLSTM